MGQRDEGCRTHLRTVAQVEADKKYRYRGDGGAKSVESIFTNCTWRSGTDTAADHTGNLVDVLKKEASSNWNVCGVLF